MSASTSPPQPQASISLSLVSHTNAGKTTLARTLLGRDVGTVRDAPHVTEFTAVFTMIEAPHGERLLLWDTPGFADSGRLVQRLRASGNPIGNPVGWFMSAVWDRWRDRAFWASQQAMRNVRDEADVMLYLVNAAESPEAAGYVPPEMELLGWLGKPVIVLLNQLGAPREAALEAAELERWRRHLSVHAQVKAVLPMDAFARCWVQEITLLAAIEATLSGEQRALMARLRAAWQSQRQQTFDAAMQALAASLARLAAALEVLPDSGGFGARLRQAGSVIGAIGARVGLGNGGADTDRHPAALAQKALAARLDAEVRSNTLALITLHGIEGEAHAQGQILARLATHFETRLALDEGKAALWGGMVSGALVGLKADILSGGLTLGGGLLAGGLLGALGAAGLARCVNLVRGTGQSWVAWNAQALDQFVEAALLRYLAVAHFGRGRGEWAQGESPAHWREVVQRAMAGQREALALVWRERDGRSGAAQPGSDETLTMAAALAFIVTQAASDALAALYPGAAAVPAAAGEPPRDSAQAGPQAPR